MQAAVDDDPVAIAPVAAGELGLVEDHEFVNGGDDVEISLPGNIVRLEDGDCLGFGHARE